MQHEASTASRRHWNGLNGCASRHYAHEQQKACMQHEGPGGGAERLHSLLDAISEGVHTEQEEQLSKPQHSSLVDQQVERCP